MTRRPRRDDFTAVSWLISRRIWVLTVVCCGLLLASIAGVGIVYGASVTTSLRTVARSAVGTLVVFLSGRALALALVQRYRDRAIRDGRIGVGADPSVVGMVTVASFSIVGLIAAVIASPAMYEVTGLYWWLATGIAAIGVTISYPLLVHQLAEKVSADRYLRNFRVSTAIWTFLWTSPTVVLAWYLIVRRGDPLVIPLPPALTTPSVVEAVGRTATIGAWDLALVAAAAPTALTFGYVVRRYLEGIVRGTLRGLANERGP